MSCAVPSPDVIRYIPKSIIYRSSDPPLRYSRSRLPPGSMCLSISPPLLLGLGLGGGGGLRWREGLGSPPCLEMYAGEGDQLGRTAVSG